MNDRLRAKSWDMSLGDAPSSIYLPNHLFDVVKCAVAILAATRDHQLRAFGLSSQKYGDRFSKLVLIAAACHDLGKANNHFQDLVSANGKKKVSKQAIRHEWLSWYLLQQPEMRSWIQSCLTSGEIEIDWSIILWSITGHHPAYGREIPSERQNGSLDSIQMLCGHSDYRDSLDLVSKTVGDSVCPFTTVAKTDSADTEILEAIRESQSADLLNWNEWSRDPSIVGLLAAVKNTLVSADVAGSALPMQSSANLRPEVWHQTIVKELSLVPNDEQLELLIQDRLTVNNTKNELRPFQREVADRASQVTLVKAGCGSGKTLAAYHWARVRCPGNRLYICYPTTGTTTEGFRDYVFDKSEHEPKFGARMFHGRSSIDHKLILETVRGEAGDDDALARMRSLSAWGIPIVTCTVDTVLGIVNNQRRAIYSWPGICNAAFVFDEIHSYDDGMFGALLAFLRNLTGIPVLLMTASLPTGRLELLRRTVRHRGDGLVEIAGPQELESLPRYNHLAIRVEDVVDRVRQELAANGKILWVSNTVDRTINAFESCSGFSNSDTVYHSRFRYIDRVERHKAVIDSFASSEAAIAWTSQVAEMSLDLSATLLVTDLAPISALIQRLGRLNRRARLETDPIRPFIVIEPTNKRGEPSSSPYEQTQLDEAREWLSRLPLSISQSDLVKAWESMPAMKRELIESSSPWIDGGFERNVKELRESSPGVTVIRREDRERVLSGECSILEVTIPMNPRYGDSLNDWTRFQGAVVVDENQINYSELLGGRWI